MTDDATHPKIIALRTIVSRLNKSTDEHANLYKEVGVLDTSDPDKAAKRRDLSDRITKNMVCMMAQAHLIQCRFFDTLAEAVGESRTLDLMRNAVIEAHENEDKENSQLHSFMKGHAPWQM